jgi:NADH-quinone oxidoreductase subunit G
MDNPYSLNTTDICPVGALTNRDFRFKARVWEMSANKSICPGCSRGCNSEIWVKDNKILRITPRLNEEVNSYWMCDHGRVNTFKHINAENRIDGPFIRKEGTLIKAEWNEAFQKASQELLSFPNNQIAFIGSAYATLEDNFVLAKFANSVIGTKHLDFMRHVDPSFGDDILRKDDITPNTLGAEAVGVKPANGGLSLEGIIKGVQEGSIKALFIAEDDLITVYPELENSFAKLELLIVCASNFNKTTSLADIIFPAATFAEKNGTFVNFQGRVQRIKPAVTTTESDRALDGLAMSRLDKFGTKYDSWAQGHKYDAKSTWKILVSLSSVMNKKLKFNLAEEVFTEISKTIDAFKGLNYDLIGELGVQSKLKLVENSIDAE